MLPLTTRLKPVLALALVATVCVSAASAQTAKAKKPKPRRPASVGPAIGGNKATPVDRITAAKGFKVELLYSVPGQDQGSWVNLCTDDKGRLLVSNQFGGLYRITPPAAGEAVQATTVGLAPITISEPTRIKANSFAGLLLEKKKFISSVSDADQTDYHT